MNQKVLSITAILIFAVVLGTVTALHFARKSSKIAHQQILQESNIVTYLPLGDSYTIGQSVAEADRWPNQLAASYRPNGKELHIVANPSVTGYTTQDLINTELPLVGQYKPDFVTVLIGVNDYVQGVSAQTFQTNLSFIISQLQSDMTKPGNILLVTIPDYAKTPTGVQFGDPATATAAIQQFNQIIIANAKKANLPYADIFTISQQVANDSNLIAGDGLHPSGKEYSAWVQIIKRSLQTARVPQL